MTFGLFWGVASVALPLFARISSISPVSQRFSKDYFFVFLIVSSVLLFGINKIKKEVRFTLFLTVLISYFNQWNFSSISTLYQFVMICASCVLSSQALNVKYKDVKTIKQGFAISCIVQSVLVIISSFGLDIYRVLIEFIFNAKTLNNTLTGISQINVGIGSFSNPNTCGAFIACTFPFLFNKKYWYFLLLPLVALYFTRSTMPVVSLLVAIPIYVLTLTKGIRVAAFFVALTSLLSLCTIFNIDSGFFGNSGRLPSWILAFDFIKNNLSFFGQGPGFIYDNYKLFSVKGLNFRQLHNEYLELIIQFGVIGAIGASIIVKKIINKFRAVENDSGLSFLVICANAFGFFNIHISSIALVLIFSCAFILRGDNVEKLES